MFVYLNGEIVHASKAKISVFDHGFMYGLGVFETFRIYCGHPFLLDDHFQRLQTSAQELGISLTYNREQTVSVLKQLCEKNNLKDAYVRWNISAGVGGLGLQVVPYESPNTVVYMKPLPPVADKKKGQVLNIRRNSPEGIVRLKSHHFLNNFLGKKELGPSPAYEGIFLNEQGFVAEGIVSNLFWVKDGIVYTPSVETGILNGITRRFILALLRKNNIPYVEGKFELKELLSADEAFMTNSIQEIVQLTHINEQLLTGRPTITKQLQKYYSFYKDKLWSRQEICEEVRKNGTKTSF